MSSIFHLPLDIRSEFAVDESGKTYGTQSGTARLCGVTRQSINELLEKILSGKGLSKPLQPFAGMDYRVSGKVLDDLLISAIINHYALYARKTTEQAKNVLSCFQVIGLRHWLRQELGWKEQQNKLSLEEIAFFANFASEAAQNAGVSKAVAESLKLDSVMQIKSEAKPLLLPQKKAIASANPIPERSLTPTEVGKELAKRLRLEKVSAQAINKKLIQLEYQVSIKRKKKSTGKIVHDYYKATEKGEAYSQLEITTYEVKKVSGTAYQLHWFSEIIDVLLEQWQ